MILKNAPDNQSKSAKLVEKVWEAQLCQKHY